MPTVHRENGFRFFFYSSEGSEPKHIHVAEGKIWLEPELKISFLHRMTPVDEKIILKIIVNNYEHFKREWDEHFK